MPVDPTKPDKDQDTVNPWTLALGAGAELVVSVLVGFLVGQWLDRKLGTEPWLMLVGAIFGISVGLYQLIQASSKRRDRR